MMEGAEMKIRFWYRNRWMWPYVTGRLATAGYPYGEYVNGYRGTMGDIMEFENKDVFEKAKEIILVIKKEFRCETCPEFID
jgi:hypothetical protein